MSDIDSSETDTSEAPNTLIYDRLCRICIIVLLGVELTGSDIALVI